MFLYCLFYYVLLSWVNTLKTNQDIEKNDYEEHLQNYNLK